MKLALTAPLPPWPLPLAHFAAHLLWALREKATVFALCDAPYRVPPLFLGGVAAQPFCDLPSLLRTKAVEVPIHLIGDDPCHLSQLRFVRECPGILVLPTLSLDRLRASLAAELFFTQLPFVHGFQGESLAIVLALLSRAVLVASEADAEFLRGMVPTIEVVALAGLSLIAPDVRAVAAALQQLAKKLCAVPVAGPAAALLPESLPRVAAIVVTYNSRSIVAPCVQSLLDQDWPALDILVVDNQSADGTADFIRSQFPSVRVIDSGANLGFGGGNNLGIKSADAKYVVLLNQDAIAQRDWVTELVRVAELDARIASVGSKLLCMRCPSVLNSTAIEINEGGFAWDRGIGERDDSPAVHPESVFGGCGGAVLYRKAAFDRVAGFDAAFFMYYEDTDLAWRLRRAGFENVYAPLAVVRHDVHGDGLPDRERVARRRYLCERNRHAIMLKNIGTASIGVLLWHLRKRDRHRLRWLDAAVRAGGRGPEIYGPIAAALRRAWRATLLSLPKLLLRRWRTQWRAVVSSASVERQLVRGWHQGGHQGDVANVHDRHSAKAATSIRIGVDDHGSLGAGFHSLERDNLGQPFRWTRQRAWFYLQPEVGSQSLVLLLASPRQLRTVRIRSDSLNGGVLNGGVLSGGALNGGALSGGVLNGGVLNGGALNGGVLNGGALNGGAGPTLGEFVVGATPFEARILLPATLSRGAIVEFLLEVLSMQVGVPESATDLRELGVVVLTLRIE
jgi:hypothetical protein